MVRGEFDISIKKKDKDKSISINLHLSVDGDDPKKVAFKNSKLVPKILEAISQMDDDDLSGWDPFN